MTAAPTFTKAERIEVLDMDATILAVFYGYDGMTLAELFSIPGASKVIGKNRSGALRQTFYSPAKGETP